MPRWGKGEGPVNTGATLYRGIITVDKGFTLLRNIGGKGEGPKNRGIR